MNLLKIRTRMAWSLALLAVLLAMPLAAKSPTADAGRQTYIVVLEQAPLAEWHRNRPESETQSLQSDGSPGAKAGRGRIKLDMESSEVRGYLQQLDEEFEIFQGDAAQALGREFSARKRFRIALNGFSASLTATEALALEALPQVQSARPEEIHRLHTDAGPPWIGAPDIWNGEGSLPAVAGEGIVIGVIDSGINWDHVSFADPGGLNGSHNFVNPLGSQKGLCSQSEVPCNNKLIGVYDFVEDNPDTDTVEENNNGEDNSGHGTHVASIALGNKLTVTLNSGIQLNISGVAPNANLISYRVCFVGDPNEDEDGCQGSAILEALDQAMADGVDVINYSLGSDAGNPWSGNSISRAMLNVVGSGIFIATSAGNKGPAASSMGSPGNAPWITAVGNASHNRIFGNTLESLVGGDTAPPQGIIGASFTDQSSGFRNIVHASDFGNALCGTGTPELGAECADNQGNTNPFAPGTFDGEIVVCDRGQYGRVEKGKNVLLAGAAGMILANTDAEGESIVADNHCLPAIHIGDTDGDALRAWLGSGNGHKGTISAFDRVLSDDIADRVVSSSSRGPTLPPVQDIMKPNLIAPGQSILGAFLGDNAIAALTGTSMSSPHVAGAAALLMSVSNDWTPAMLASVLQLTATPELSKDFDDGPATPHERGAGRPRLADAANAGLFLNETAFGFTNANPSMGGSPRDLNLASLMDAACDGSCSFTRIVTNLVGGKTWTAAPEGFPDGVEVTITPSNFFLSSGGSRTLTITIDLGDAGVVGSWVYGSIRLSAGGVPDAVMPTAVFATGGELPAEWHLSTDKNGGWQEFQLSDLTAMPQATFTSGGLVMPQLDDEFLVEDPTRDNPYNGGSGIMTVWHTVPEGALWLHAETLASTSQDVDLFVGRDVNGNGLAEQGEEICSSTTPQDLELCDIFNPVAGEYWVIAQNWKSSSEGASDEVFLETAVIPGGTGAQLNATGPGRVAAGETFKLRLSWHDVKALSGDKLLGAVGVGTHRDTPANIGVIPVNFTRSGVAAPETLPLMDGVDHQFALPGLSSHERAFIDIPQGASELRLEASGGSSLQNNGLQLDLHRIDFDAAFSQAPFASPSPAGTPVMSASGGGGNGPQLTVTGATLLQPGRWYARLRNNNPGAASVTLRAEVDFSGAPIPVNGYLWISAPRPNISQGIDFQPVGAARGMLWYTYGDNKNPAWYLSAGMAPAGNIWHGKLLRFTNDGQVQQFVEVGRVSMTMLEADDSIFSWALFGKSGSERMDIIAGLVNNPCPDINSVPTSISGFWGKAQEGLGGASVLFTDSTHPEIHYLFDAKGNPVWLQAAGANGNDITLTQFQGYCPTCSVSPITNQDVGVLTHDYQSESSASWEFNYMLAPPLSGDVNRSDNDVVKLSDVRECD